MRQRDTVEQPRHVRLLHAKRDAADKETARANATAPRGDAWLGLNCLPLQLALELLLLPLLFQRLHVRLKLGERLHELLVRVHLGLSDLLLLERLELGLEGLQCLRHGVVARLVVAGF